MTAGFSLGPLTSGLLGQFAPAPTVLPYLLHVALVVVGLVLAVRLPETVDLRRPGAGGDGTPAGAPLIRRGDGLLVVTVLAPVAVCVYAFPSTIISAVPLLVDLPYGGVAVTGVLAGVTLGAGTLVAGLQRRLLVVDRRRRRRLWARSGSPPPPPSRRRRPSPWLVARRAAARARAAGCAWPPG